MSDILVLFLFLTGAIAATIFFLRGAFHVARVAPRPVRRAWSIAKDIIKGDFLAVAHPLALARAAMNPVLTKGNHFFDAGAVMNPGAIIAGGRVHLFYRAIGMDGVSRIGYASSEDGLRFDDRLPYPVYALRTDDAEKAALERRQNDPALYEALYASGGTWSGTEDPRAVVIDGRMYLSFSAFYNWNSLRIGVISIAIDDLLRKDWKWSKPVFLSAPGEVQKNWVLFPERINGKFAVLHAFKSGTRRRAIIDYLDTLDEEPKQYIKSDARFRNDASEFDDNVWDHRVRGVGPPPLRTEHGWLVLYHAVDARQQDKYKLGALLLDLKDPTKIIARSTLPVLEPDMAYENDGKPGVIYVTGAVIENGTLIVYYGGGDNVICAAVAPLRNFLATLKAQKRPAFLTKLKK